MVLWDLFCDGFLVKKARRWISFEFLGLVPLFFFIGGRGLVRLLILIILTDSTIKNIVLYEVMWGQS